VAKNAGPHVFWKTLDGQNRNVAQWQKRYWQNRRDQR